MDLENARGRIAGIPKRVPLIARLEDQIADIGNGNVIPEQRSNACPKDETVFVLAMMRGADGPKACRS
jgi:hypothetical protein